MNRREKEIKKERKLQTQDINIEFHLKFFEENRFV
jgi:hypothetical protein